jgi:uncharacterized hydrophobic protein (TIGR00271 family)
MAGYVDSALFIYSEAGAIYLDLIGQNPQNISILPVPITEFRLAPETFTERSSHLLISAELSVIKEVMKQVMAQNVSIGLLPLPGQRMLARCYAIPNDPDEMLALALKDNPDEVDIVFCNDEILLFKGLIGRVPLFDSLGDAGKISIIWNGLRRIFTLYLLPFNFESRGKINKKTETAASGCLILEDSEGSFAPDMIGHDCSIDDGMISALIVAPFSIMEYLKLMWLRVRSDFHVSKIRTSIGYIRSPELIISSDKELSVTIDGEKCSVTPAHFHVKPAALRLNHGKTKSSRQSPKASKREKHATKFLPAGKELSKAVNKRVPFFTYASEERFKDLFIALRDDAQLNATYVVLMILSTVLATVGLFLNSASVVIGAMLLAPLMAPIISLAMSLLRFERKLFKQSLWKIFVGILLALGTALILTSISPYQPMTTEMQGRLHPTLLDLIVAIAAGIAGAYTKSHREIAQSLAGVAIAVALVPPLAVAGVGLGRLDLHFFGLAFLLFSTNLIGIVLAATFTFRMLGFSPVVRNKRGVITITVFFLLICIPLSLAFQRITAQTHLENSWKIERFVVNGKYLIVDGARLLEFKESDILEVELQARELLTRYDLSEFRRKVKQNFGRDLIIRVNITYIP